MAFEITMPQMGESVVEGTIAKWLVKEGDQIAEDQPLCEISTDKVDTEIPSPSAGVIAQLVAKEGETLPVGAVLAVIESEAGARPAAQPTPASKPGPMTQEVGDQMHAGERDETERIAPTPTPISKPAPRPQALRPDAAPVNAAATGPEEHRRYSPVVIKIAAEHGIDLNRVPGTGIGGRVSKRDVMKYIESLRGGAAPMPTAEPPHHNGTGAAPAARPAPQRPAAPAQAPPASAFHPPIYEPREGDTVEPFTRRRKLIAEYMAFSKTHSPHVPTLAEVDVTRVVRMREAHKRAFREREGFALTMLPLVAAAVVRALKEFPRMNASVAGDSLVIRKQINLGIAMDAEEVLLVPVIKAAEAMSVTGLAREMERLRIKVQEKKITADDLSGGSFTLSNPGREGNLFGFAIINQPQVGILRMGEVKKRPIVIEVDGSDAIVIRSMMYLALSYDHRVIDGVLGNRFLYRTARILEEANFALNIGD